MASVALLLAVGSAAAAQETTTYSYDALGRLVQTKKTVGRDQGLQSDYEFDDAGNRKAVTVVGAQTRGVVVVPLLGGTLIVSQ